MAEVVLTDVSKVYPGNIRAVRCANLTIHDREFVVLVGPSGCGKTTTLRMIAGLEEISEGTISIGGKIVNDVPPKDRDIAMVFQNYALYPHMTAYENMAFGLKLRKYPREEIDRRVREAAQMMGITELLDRRPKALSGGERQRVAVGRAIVRKPAVFLFDEPLSNLDAKMRVEMRVELKKLHTRLQSTMVYVTHDQIEAMTLGERIVVMKDGEIQQVDEPLNIYEEPANEFVAGFIGAPPMNFLHGTIEQAAGGLVFTDGHARIAIPKDIEERVRGSIGKSVKLGIRPENIHDRAFSAAPPPGSTIEAKVDVVEALGDEKLVYFSTPRGHFIGRMDAHQKVGVGTEMEVVLNLDKIHIFDSATGRNLTVNARAGARGSMAAAS